MTRSRLGRHPQGPVRAATQRQRRWRIERISFLAEPVSMVLPPEPRGRMLAALNLGPLRRQAACLRRRRRHLARGRHAGLSAAARRARRAGVEAGADLVAGGGAWRRLGRHAARRPVPFARWRCDLAAGRVAVEPPRAARVVRRRLRRARHPFDLPAPAAAGELLVGISCGGVWVTATAARRGRCRPTACAPPTCRPNGRRPEHPRPAPDRALRRRTRRAVVPASQRHLALDRRRPSWQEIVGAPLSSFGFAVAVHPAEPDTAWFVPGSRRREPRAGRRRAGRQPHARRRPQLRDAARRPAAAALLRPRLPPRPGGRRLTAARC